MSASRVTVVTALCAVLAGCHIRPMPQDFTGIGTTRIVTQIRCETYNALLDGFANLLERDERRNDGVVPTVKPGTAERLRSGDLRFETLSAKDVGPLYMKQVRRYRNVTVGYSFNLDMLEKNNLKGAAGFERPYLRGPFTIGVEAESNRSRQNVRTFRIIDKWGDLLEDKAENNTVHLDRQLTNYKLCRPQKNVSQNFDIPINGKIGMSSQIATFYNLYETGNLTGLSDKIPTMTDTVSFVSFVRGAVNPSITIAPLSDAFRLASAGGGAEIVRQDSHQVIIVIAAPEIMDAGDEPAAKQLVNQELLRQEDNEKLGVNQALIRRLADQSRPF